MPEACEECISSGHLTPLLGWMLDQDPGLRVGVFTPGMMAFSQGSFCKSRGTFADSLESQTDALSQQYPSRFRRFIVDGVQHTALIGDASGVIGSDPNKLEYPENALSNLLGTLVLGQLETTEVDGVNLASWVDAMIETTWKNG